MSKSQPYDGAMVQDFFDHLTWECRISIHEQKHPGTAHPELVDNLAAIIKKRGSVLPIYDIEVQDVEASRAKMIENYERMLAALETLRPLLRESTLTIKGEEDGHRPPWEW